MVKVIGVKLRGTGKSYYFSPGEEKYLKDDKVIVETSKGMEVGTVTFSEREVESFVGIDSLKEVVRKATEEDMAEYESNLAKEKEAYSYCLKKIEEHELDMSLVDAQYTFDGKKLIFYFTSDDRVDFRGLVKDLAAYFHTRIELRQIGVRDECRMLGGIGVCGNELCCRRFLTDFQPVSVKMAKEQGKSLAPTKISGACGRLMCCLQYEQSTYEELSKLVPRNGAQVKTPEGNGVVVETNVLMSTVKVRLEDNDNIKQFDAEQVSRIFTQDGNGGHQKAEKNKED